MLYDGEMQKILEKAVENTRCCKCCSNRTDEESPASRAQACRQRLLKKVWVQVADKLGMSLAGIPAYVGIAAAPGGDYPEDAEARRIKAAANSQSMVQAIAFMTRPSSAHSGAP